MVKEYQAFLVLYFARYIVDGIDSFVLTLTHGFCILNIGGTLCSRLVSLIFLLIGDDDIHTNYVVRSWRLHS